MKQISILGCGWLGLPLAKSLLKNGFLVNGSTTTLDKISLLNSVGINAHQIELSETEIKGQIDLFLATSEILIIDIPPKIRSVSNENFLKKIENLIPHIEKSSVQKVIFISSTSVYADYASTELSVTELTKPQPETESGKQLLKTENLLLSNSNFKTTVIRFGGLVGENRHPIHFLAGKKNIENPDAPINLIHQIDCIGIIISVIIKGLQQTNPNSNLCGEIFNAVAPFHPKRKEYYTQKALELNLASPLFQRGKISKGKTISTDKIFKILGYQYKNTSL